MAIKKVKKLVLQNGIVPNPVGSDGFISVNAKGVITIIEERSPAQKRIRK